MRARDVIGRRIVAVHQTRCFQSGGQGTRPIVHMDVWLELDNGDRLFPIVGELDGDYAVDFGINRVGRHTGRKRREVKP